MSPRKLCFLAMLGTILVFTAVGGSDVQIKESDVPKPRAVFVPVQSKKAKDLGVAKLLVASRDLGDPNFVETVVLLVHYDDEGVVGLILNRRSNVPLSRVFDGLKAAQGRSDPVYLGGPVETAAAFALLQSPSKVEGAQHIFGEVYLISTKALFEQTMSARSDPGVFHTYLGYAGWSNEQLRREVELGAWFIFPADARTVFNADPDSLWSQFIRKTELKLAESGPADRDHAASQKMEPLESAAAALLFR